MSEEQPSGKSRVCAIHCRLFLLGCSSNIGFFLAYAFRLASGTAYSSSPRAPSPRVPPDATCAVPPMHCPCMNAGTPYKLAACPFDGHPLDARDICIGRIVGALLAYGRRLSLPSLRLRLLPFRRSALPRFSLAPAAHARPCALTLYPPGFALLFGRARPASLPSCAGVPLSLAFPQHLCAPLRSAHTLAYLPPCGLRFATPTHPSPACVDSPTVGRRG